MRFLFLFIDGVGLGPDDAKSNPFSTVHMPNLENILNGRSWIETQELLPLLTERTTFLSLDACLGIEGSPQSASGQTTLLTGQNIPLLIGKHYGPKPNAEIRAFLENGNLFSKLKQSGYRVCLLNAFPETDP